MSAPSAAAPVTIVAAPGSSSAGAALNTSALAAVIGRLKDAGGAVFKQQKPWSEVLDRTTLSKPANVTEALSRVKKNAAYFKINYLLVVLATTVVTFLVHPGSLLVLAALLGAWVYVLFVRTAPLVIGGRQVSEREKMLGMAVISFVTIFFLTSVGTVFFSALSFSLAVVVAHGAFREPDNLFVDDQESTPMLFGILPTATAAPTGMAAV